MALKKGMDEVLAQIADPKEREEQRRMFEKYPVLQDGYLAQAEFNRNMDQFRRDKEEQEAQHAKWTKWHQEVSTQYETDMKAKADADAKVAELQQKLAAGGDVTQEELKAAIQSGLQAELANGKYMTADQFNAEVEKRVKAAGEQVAAQNKYLMDVNRYARKYEREFDGKEFDDTAFNKFVADGGFQTVEQAYNAYVAEDRKKIEIDKAVKDAVAKREAELKQEFSSQAGLPGANAFPQSAPGPVQLYIAPKEDAANKGDYKLGDMTAAKLASQELRNEGKIAPA